MSKTWFITGTSRGLGRAWAAAALERGDRVAATARDTAALEPLVQRFGDAVLPLRLDVVDRDGAFDAVRRAQQTFGRLDVVINNAGYGHFGTVEELTEDEARAQLDANLFGALWITQAALPVMREQGAGLIAQVSSVGGVVAYPGLGVYHASKWALEGLTEALRQEVGGFGVRTMIVEPSAFGTDWAGASASRSEPNPAYQPLRDHMAEYFQGADAFPAAEDAVAGLFAAVDAEEPPARLILGSHGFDTVLSAYEERVATWRRWETTSRAIG